MNPSDFDRIGELLRDHVDAPESETSRALLRARVIKAATPSRPRRAVPLLAAAALLASVVAVVLVIVWRRPAPEPISFQVGDTSPQPGTWLAPAGSQPLSLTFSEGSTIVLDPHARARIAQTSPNGASFQLESGRAHFKIVHRANTEWNVAAGPYSVRVRGTSFAASWDAAAEVFELTLESGSVIVRGPGIESGVQLDGVQHFVGRPGSSPSPAACASAQSEPAATNPAPSVENPVAPPSSDPSLRPPSSSAAPSASAPVVESWSALAAKGQFRTIVDEAESKGVSASINASSAADLWALAEAARLTGKGALARQALLAVRSRFPGSPKAASAAFLLGRMSDDGGNSGEAISWYDRYVAEAPGGSFVPEAVGRRMVALRKAGNVAEAQQAASAYLQRFPNGPYAGVARDLVEP